MYAPQPDEEGNKFYIKTNELSASPYGLRTHAAIYKDLPLTIFGACWTYSYELQDTLTGFIRMRGPITQNDSHMYMTDDQVEQEFDDLLAFFKICL